ncbi:hypothetical protein NDU88_001133 [Pleurodeles waltl]|uniref:Uncharacterized protein n=1 Tax=Pleurodeles waltl TaxID=8319 RepID=A0AAV7VYJ1_PLEWA|nr:hypothetical protein NDU88_001133 [Pleurodeles waltl]
MDRQGDLQDLQGPTVAQILAAIEASSPAVQVKIEAIALDVNLLRSDVCKVLKRSVAIERHVSDLHEEMRTLKATVVAIET